MLRLHDPVTAGGRRLRTGVGGSGSRCCRRPQTRNEPRPLPVRGLRGEEPGEGPGRSLTVLQVVGVGRQAQGGGTVLALEAAAVEELALGAQPLHHVHALLAEVAGVAAAQVLRELLPHGALRGTSQPGPSEPRPAGAPRPRPRPPESRPAVTGARGPPSQRGEPAAVLQDLTVEPSGRVRV